MRNKRAESVLKGTGAGRKSEDRAPLTYIFVLAPSVFYPTPRVDTSETNDPDGGKKRRKQERKEGRKDVGRTKGRNAWKIDRFEKNRDRSFVDE